MWEWCTKAHASVVTVYLQVRDAKTGDLIDGTDEQEFPFSQWGEREAEKYAKRLRDRHAPLSADPRWDIEEGLSSM
jgi:hypothetical protein